MGEPVLPADFFAWLESTAIARSTGGSLPIIASLSAIHLLGFTLITSGALVANLRLLDALLPSRPAADVTGPASLGIAIGLAVSIATGLPLFAWRAGELVSNGTFQLKMLLLVGATTYHFTLHRSVARRPGATSTSLRLTGAVGLALWLGLALVGCAFILFE
jgi:hypothetical protein